MSAITTEAAQAPANTGAAQERGEFVRISEPEQGIWVLRLNRPEAMNSWNARMRAELAEAMEEVAMSDARVVLVRGDAKAFSAGEDVRGMAGLTQGGTKKFRAVARQIHSAFDLIEAIEAPFIAVIEGVAAGGGMELALSCDFRIAGRNARLGLPEGNVGLIPGSGGCSRLVRCVGAARAKQVVMLEGVMKAERANELGLLTQLVDAGQEMEAAMEMARKLAAKAPLALGMAKLVINTCADVDLETGRRLERIGQSVLKKSADHAEGAQSFIEKRKPNWTAT
ncbi:MAG: enoyl-CoA hydratase/isomerase family protein [Pseudomonadota bacterium]